MMKHLESLGMALLLAVAAILLALMLTGCAVTSEPPRVELQTVNVPLPVECREPVPARPAMPTEALQPGADVDVWTRASMAEIERREGYEGELRAALDACRQPLAGPMD